MTKNIKRALPKWALQQTSQLDSPMVFLTGPRQVGKTFLVKNLTESYYNWDTREVRKQFSQDHYFFRSENPLVVFDEIHKRRDWKKLLKGYYDSPTKKENFIVTGSGKMNIYRRGGDSLQGRYDLFQLWPFSYDEIYTNGQKLTPPPDWKNFEPKRGQDDSDLINLGGFPIPFLKGSQRYLERWQEQYLDRLVHEDTRDFSAVQRLDQLDLLARLLPSRMTVPLSLLSLAEDIECSRVAIKAWLRLFEILYFGFLLKPYHRKIHRAVKKEAKWYFYQWTYAKDPGLRFENYLAIQINTVLSAWTEQGYGRWELYYLRDQSRREIDFVICHDLKPVALVEAKHSFQSFPSSLRYYCNKLKIPGFLVYNQSSLKKIKREEHGYILPSSAFLKNLLWG